MSQAHHALDVSATDPSSRDLTAGDVGFAVLVLFAVALLLPAQIGSMILFDSTGLDTLVPDLVFMAVVPAVAIAAVVGLATWWRYTTRTGLWIGTGAFLLCSLVAAYLAQFYGLCGGPGC